MFKINNMIVNRLGSEGISDIFLGEVDVNIEKAQIHARRFFSFNI